MKKLIKLLLGNDFLKGITLDIANKIITIFVTWLLSKIHEKYGSKIWYYELANFMTNIQIEDFLNDKKEDINKII
jgi:hypothetical protein